MKTRATTKKLTGQPCPAGRPLVAVVGEHDPEPHRGDADARRGEHRRDRTAREPQRARRRPDQQRGAEDRADGDRREGGRECERHEVEHADEPHRNSASGCHLGAHGAQQQRPVEGEHDRQHDRAQQHDQRERRARDREHRAEQDRHGRAGGALFGRCQIEEQRGEPDRGAEHDPGGEVAPARALDADRLHRTRRDEIAQHESPEGADPDEERPGASGGPDVAEGLAGEGLPADHREHADDPGHDRHQRPDADRDVDRFAVEESGCEERSQEMAHERTSASGNAPSCPARSASSPAPATISTRPWTSRTSTWWP